MSVAFPEGSVTAVLGQSGVGKTTLLKLLNGLLRPDCGEVRVFGKPMPYDRLPALRRRIGYAVQNAALFPHLSVGRNILLPAELEGWPAAKARERRDHLLDMLELPRTLIGRWPGQLSGGQQQRASLCRALMLAPPLLLLDEPFSALDPATRPRVRRAFGRLVAREGTSVVFVTHDLAEAEDLASRAVVLDRHRVHAAGAWPDVRPALPEGFERALAPDPADA